MEKKNGKKTDRVVGLIALATIIIAWFVGSALEEAGVETYLYEVMPEAGYFEQLSPTTYAGYESISSDEMLGYVVFGEGDGYGGPMTVAVAFDLDGTVENLVVVSNIETPSFFDRVMDSRFIGSFYGKSYSEEFRIGEDIDSVTGATYTSNGIAEAVRDGSQLIGVEEFFLDAMEEESTEIVFGLREIALLALIVICLLLTRLKKFKFKKQLRWGGILLSIVTLGFLYTSPLTLSFINRLLLGFWPQWQTNLYWYIMLAGVLIVLIVDNRNMYYSGVCPFGAAQECLGVIGGAKAPKVGKYHEIAKWVPRVLAWLAIVLALIFRNPGLTSYEIFGTLFSLNGSMIQFIMLGIVLISSLFIKRPWCRYVCPVCPTIEYGRMSRNWIKELWEKNRKNPKTTVSE